MYVVVIVQLTKMTIMLSYCNVLALSHSLLNTSGQGDSSESGPSGTLSSPNKPINTFQPTKLIQPTPQTPTPPRRRKPNKLKPDLKLKCGACGNVSIKLQYYDYIIYML